MSKIEPQADSIALPEPTKADEPHNCRHCKKSLLGTPIPENSRQHYGESRYFKLEIGHYDWKTDRTEYYSCPHCKRVL